MGLMQGLSGFCIDFNLMPVNSFVPVGTYTALGSVLSMSAADKVAGEIYGEDMAGMLTSAQVKACELIMQLNSILSRLPAGDSNIATLQTLIADLS
jgi:hypothetical protein